jgi:Tfp pilus assembly protein PilE
MRIERHHALGASQTPSQDRRGLGMAEVLAAAALMSVVTVVVLPIVTSVAAAREESSRRHLAVLEVANLMEQIAALRQKGALTDDALNALALPDSAAEHFDEPELSVQLAEPAGTPPARELSVSLTWLNAAGERVEPVHVTAFLYEQQESP